MGFSTDQEEFWAGDFGNKYIERSKNKELVSSNINFFVKALRSADKINSCIEFGANIGLNLIALRLLYPKINLKGIEINLQASKELSNLIGKENVINKSIFDTKITTKSELVLIKGVLIHINPEKLEIVYEKLYQASKKYILICEYYNPNPVSVNYRGHKDKLFKRDFADEFLNKYNNLTLLDYGFIYRKDPSFPQDDITWFLIKKDDI